MRRGAGGHPAWILEASLPHQPSPVLSPCIQQAFCPHPLCLQLRLLTQHSI